MLPPGRRGFCCTAQSHCRDGAGSSQGFFGASHHDHRHAARRDTKRPINQWFIMPRHSQEHRDERYASARSRSTRTAGSTTPRTAATSRSPTSSRWCWSSIEFQVVDAKTGDDLTRAILLQIILDEESGGVPMFTSDMLAQMIRFYGNAQQGIMGQYLEQNVKALPRDPEEAAGAGEAALRRQDDAHARAVDAVHADAGARDAGHARQLPRAERQDVHADAGAHAGPDAQHVRRFPFPNFIPPTQAGGGSNEGGER